MKRAEKIVKLILGAGVVICCYYLGELISLLIKGFISPSVLGMITLFILLKTGLLKKDRVADCATLLTDNMILFFIPITVGVALIPASVLKEDGIAMIMALVLSTFVVLWVAGTVVEKYKSKRR